MTPWVWFTYITVTTCALAVSFLIAAIAYFIYLALRNWLVSGADTPEVLTNERTANTP